MRLRKRKLPPHEQVEAEIAELERELAPELGLEIEEPVVSRPPPPPPQSPPPPPQKRAPVHRERGEFIFGAPYYGGTATHFVNGSQGNYYQAAPVKTIWIEPGYKKSDRVHKRHQEETA